MAGRGNPPGTNNGGGRRKGQLLDTSKTSTTRRTVAKSKILPLEVLQATMEKRWFAAQAEKDEKRKKELELEACAVAEKTAPYMHAKLNAMQVRGDPENPLKFLLELPDSSELKKAIRGGGEAQ